MAFLLFRATVFILLIAGCAAVLPKHGQVSNPGLNCSGQESAGAGLSISVTMVMGEHGRDSNSMTTSLTVHDNSLAFEQTYHGARSNRHPPVTKEYRLEREDTATLIAVLNERHLLVDENIATSTETGNVNRYFELAIRSKLNDKEHTISITGPRNDPKVKENRTYRDSIYLIEQLYKIINRTDPDITMPEIID